MKYTEIIQNAIVYCGRFSSLSNESFKDYMKSNDGCEKIVRTLFSELGKSACEDVFLSNNVCVPKYRFPHIVYTFLMGIYMYNEHHGIKGAIDSKLDEYNSKECYHQDVKFEFLWLLICLFHDLGYVYEKEKDDSSSSLVKANHAVEQHNEPLKGVPACYQNTYKKYLSIIHQKDHGILGGVMMYQTLCENRAEKAKIAKDNNRTGWKKGLEDIYNIASSIVICHNIRYATKGTVEEVKYANEGMNELIRGKREYKINLQNYPLCYLFSLVDTIEPYKRLKKYSRIENVNINIMPDKIEIVDNSSFFRDRKYLKGCASINTWLSNSYHAKNVVTIVVHNPK